MQAVQVQALSMGDVTLRAFSQEDGAWLTAQHGQLYMQDEGFDETFEVLVGGIIDGFLADHDPACERGWIAEQDGLRLGSIFCVRLTDEIAKLRLFLLTPDARGKGLGRQLLDTCMSFAKSSGYAQMQLWTHESHTAACALYAKTGWCLVSSKPVHSFGVDLVEQSWKIEL